MAGLASVAMPTPAAATPGGDTGGGGGSESVGLSDSGAAQLPPARWPVEPREYSVPKVLGAAALVSGAMVGAGLIALPSRTLAAGFGPTAAALGAVALYLLVTALLLAEAAFNSGAPPGANLLTLATRLLGRTGRVVTWATYLLIYLPTITAYIAEGGNLVAHFTMHLLPGLETGPAVFQLGFAAVFGTVVLRGPATVDTVNRAAVALAMATFVALVLAAASGVSLPRLGRADWSAVPRSIPVILVAMAFHNTVPTVAAYLGSAPATMTALTIGVAIPVFMYLVWEALIIGSLDPAGFSSDGLTATIILDQLQEQAGQAVSVGVELFELLAIVTSVLGVGLGTVDFLHEGIFGIDSSQTAGESQTHRRIAVIASFGPAAAVAIVAPGVFLPALELSVSARLALFGIIPVLLVWNMRYGASSPSEKMRHDLTDHLNVPEPAAPPGTVPGGRPMLLAVGVISTGLILFDWQMKFHRLMGG